MCTDSKLCSSIEPYKQQPSARDPDFDALVQWLQGRAAAEVYERSGADDRFAMQVMGYPTPAGCPASRRAAVVFDGAASTRYFARLDGRAPFVAVRAALLGEVGFVGTER